MRIHRIQVQNFRNFKDLDVIVGDQVVVLGENKIGKSNLVYALRLVLDPSLPDTARQLQRTDFWDGLGETLTKDWFIQVSIELTDFEDDENLLALLAEHLITPTPMVARLTYAFQPRTDLKGEPTSEADYEFLCYGGNRPENRFGYELRRRIPLDVMPALRDVERDLAVWSQSPLRPLLNAATRGIDREELKAIARQVQDATVKVLDIHQAPIRNVGQDEAVTDEQKESGQAEAALPPQPFRQLETLVTSRLADMVGPGQELQTQLGITPSEPERLIRAIRLLIDDGKRGIGEASLGSANLLYLVLKSLELDRLVTEGQRNHTVLAIEEPEAHLHPHLQRLVYRDFLHRRSLRKAQGSTEPTRHPHQTVLLTTHSPHIASVSPLRSIVVLRRAAKEGRTYGVSASGIDLTDPEIEDIERYLDVNRGEILFARGVILVEGEAEEYIIPALGKQLGFDFDELGISVCSVAGTNFLPYAKLLNALSVPYAVVTDLDPKDDGRNLGEQRIIGLVEEVCKTCEVGRPADSECLELAPMMGFFLGTHTLEIDLFLSGCHERMCKALIELTTNDKAKDRALTWSKKPKQFDREQLIKDISEVGKGRYAQRLASRLAGTTSCPGYIQKAINYVVSNSR